MGKKQPKEMQKMTPKEKAMQKATKAASVKYTRGDGTETVKKALKAPANP